jgi:hypothetical protein
MSWSKHLDGGARVPKRTRIRSEQRRVHRETMGVAGASRDDGIELQPRFVSLSDRVIRLLGMTDLFAAAFLILHFVGSLWFLWSAGSRVIAHNAGNRLLQIWVIERGLALPLLIALHFWLARGLTRMRGRAILAQTILSALVATWALILTLGDVSFFRVALDEVEVAPHVVLIDFAYYLTKFVSGFSHALVAFLLIRFRRAEIRRDAESIGSPPSAATILAPSDAISETSNVAECAHDANESNVSTADYPNRVTALIGSLLAIPAAIVLSLGTLWSVRWLILELARRLFEGAPLA